MPSISLTFRPASSMALFMASTKRSRLDTPGTRPSRLLPMPTMAQASRSSCDGPTVGALKVSSMLRSLFDQLADARDHIGRCRIDAVEQFVDGLPADRIDVGILRLGVGEKVRILHGGVERRAQGGDAIARRAG